MDPTANLTENEFSTAGRMGLSRAASPLWTGVFKLYNYHYLKPTNLGHHLHWWALVGRESTFLYSSATVLFEHQLYYILKQQLLYERPPSNGPTSRLKDDRQSDPLHLFRKTRYTDNSINMFWLGWFLRWTWQVNNSRHPSFCRFTWKNLTLI